MILFQRQFNITIELLFRIILQTWYIFYNLHMFRVDTDKDYWCSSENSYQGT